MFVMARQIVNYYFWRQKAQRKKMYIIHKNDCPVHLYTSAIYSITAFYFKEITS